MIKIYMSSSCSSCRKVKAWFDDQKIPYQEINILTHTITVDELKEMLNKSLDGTDDIVSTRSKIIKERKVNIDSMSVAELCQFIKDNPTILKRPIIVDDSKIQVGYNSDEIEIFEKAKRLIQESCNPKTCPGYASCDHHAEPKTIPACDDTCDDKKR
jgi:regulatory protein spx